MRPLSLAAGGLLAPLLFAPALSGSRAPAELEYRAVHLGGAVHLLEPVGESSHRLTVAVSGGEGLLCDASFARNAPAVRAALEELGVERLRYLVNTHFHSDHTDGNRELGRGALILAHARTRADLVAGTAPTPEPPLPAAALPTVTFEDSLTVHLGEEEVRLHATPAGHTAGDVVVHFVGARVVHLGDVVLAPGCLPYTTDVEAWIASVDELLAWLPAGTMLVPGHGPAMELGELRALRDFVVLSRDYVAAGLDEGEAPAELVASRPEAWSAWSSRFLAVDDWLRELCAMLR